MFRLALIFSLICLLGCNSERSHSNWEIMEIEGNPPFQTEMTGLRIYEKEVLFFGSDASTHYPIIKNGDRMIIFNDESKILTQLKYQGDSVLIITELYSKEPFKIKLKKID